ncbi:TIGR02099 family protein [Burkholderiaceae bacterium DAT-1]|nr:TIGR02099 family protein [Burkholderiaceae bacterium DAT-1]
MSRFSPSAIGRKFRTGFNLCFSAVHWQSRVLIWIAAILMTVVLGLSAWLQWWMFPHLDEYRGKFESTLTQSLGRDVEIRRIHGGWRAFQPWVQIDGFSLADQSGKPALQLAEVEGTLAWWPFLIGDIRLDSLTAIRPDLTITREKNGQISVAGILLNHQGGDNRLMDWMLRNHRLGIQQGRILWRDEMRGGVPLVLDQVDLEVENQLFGRHSLKLSTTPPARLAQPFRLEANWSGDSLDAYKSWEGELRGGIAGVDLAAWGQWIPYPVDVHSGKGSVDLAISFRAFNVNGVDIKLDVRDTAMRIAPELDVFRLSRLGGQLHWHEKNGQHTLTANNLALATGQNPVLNGGALKVEYSAQAGSFSFDKLVVPPLSGLESALPLPPEVRKAMNGMHPSGRIDSVSGRWKGNWRHPSSYSGEARFSALALTAPAPWPSSGPLSGRVTMTQAGGEIDVSGKQFSLVAPGILPDPLSLDTIALKGSWTYQPDMRFVLKQLSLSSRAIQASAKGEWRAMAGTSGYLDLNAEVARVNARDVRRFLPVSIGPETHKYLDASLKEGEARNIKIIAKGPLDAFPFPDNKEGVWLVEGDAHDVKFEYTPGWPGIDHLDGKLRFSGNRMEILGKGEILGTHIESASAVIPDLSKADILTVTGKVSGPTSEFFRFINKSPLDEALSGFGREAKAVGNGDLDLQLDIPLDHAENTRVDGRYRFNRNQIQLLDDMPNLFEARGEVHFTEHGADAKGITANALGGKVRADINTLRDGTMRIEASGSLQTRQAAQRYDIPFGAYLAGSTDYQLEVALPKEGGWQIGVNASMRDTTVSLPAPLTKAAGESRPLRLALEQHANGQAQRWRFMLGDTLEMDMRRSQGKDGWKTDRGEITIGKQTPSPVRPGMWVVINHPELTLDPWLDVLGQGSSASTSAASSDSPINGIDIQTARLKAFGRQLNTVSAQLRPAAQGWSASVKSKELRGNALWSGAGGGRLSARLANLSLPIAAVPENRPTGSPVQTAQHLPALDIKAESVSLSDRVLGKLAIRANPVGDAWQIQRFELSGDDLNFTADGAWKSSGAENHTDMNFSLSSGNLGKMFERFGYPEVIKRGNGKLTGQLTWAGAPYAPTYASLNGKIHIDLESGQFMRYDQPGIGRLISIFSLASLPRRLMLDFRDVFSDGFVFDRVQGDSAIVRGIMSTDNLDINGPPAKANFKGKVDLPANTVQLRVRVVPTLSDPVSVTAGLALANPAIGVGSLLLQKVLKDPVGQIFAQEIDISGSLDDPKIEGAAKSGSN